MKMNGRRNGAYRGSPSRSPESSHPGADPRRYWGSRTSDRPPAVHYHRGSRPSLDQTTTSVHSVTSSQYPYDIPSVSQQGSNSAVTSQPRSQASYPYSGASRNGLAPVAEDACPPGLECLADLEDLFILNFPITLENLEAERREKAREAEERRRQRGRSYRNPEMNKDGTYPTEVDPTIVNVPRYQVINNKLQTLFIALEESSAFQRMCFATVKGFALHVLDDQGREVIQLQRDFNTCAACMATCCDSSYMSIEAPPGVVIGYVKYHDKMFGNHFSMHDHNFTRIATIQGPGYANRYHIVRPPSNEIKIGEVEKVLGTKRTEERQVPGGCLAISFLRDLSIRHKAIYLSAAFLVEFSFYAGQ